MRHPLLFCLHRLLPALGLLLLGHLAQAQMPDLRPLVGLDLLGAAGTMPDQSFVYFQAGATDGFDPAYDASKLANPTGLNLSSYIAGTTTQLAINGLPPYTPGVPVSVQLFVGVPAFGPYRFQVNRYQNFVDTRVYLRDALLGTRTVLAVGVTYSFDMTAVNTNNTYTATNRFFLDFFPLSDLVVTNSMPPPLATYRNVTITGTGNLQLDKDLDVAGTLTVQDGGIFDTGSAGTVASDGYTLTGTAFVMEPGSRILIQSHDGITASAAQGSIRTTSRSYASDAVYTYSAIKAAATTAVTGNGLPATVRYLGAVVYNVATGVQTPGTLMLSQPVAITRTLDLLTNLNTNGQALTLRSTPTGSTAIVGVITGTLTGLLTTERAIDPTYNSGAGYRHFSNPFGGVNFGYSGGFTPVLNPAYNTSATPNLVSPFPNLFTYDFTAIASSPATTYSNFDKGWRAVNAGPNSLARGKGFIANIAPNSLLTFTGYLNEVAQAVPVPANPGPDLGWMLLGNPFAAPLDGSLLTRPASVPAAVHVFESTGQYAGHYRSYINGVGASPVVPVGQAFFMSQSAGGAAGTLTMPLAARKTVGATTAPTLHRATADLRPQVQLTLRSGTQADDLYVYCEAGATAAFDAAFDAAKLSSPGQVELAALAGQQALSISGIPALNAAQTSTVPLRVGLPQAGTFTLEATALTNLAGTDVYLLDANTGRVVNLRQQPRYTFSAAAGTLAGRFALQFGLARPTATASAALAAAVALYPNPAHGNVTVSLPAVAGATAVAATVLDALGRPVWQQEAAATAAGTALVLPTAGLAPGVYSVQLRVGGQVLTKRLVVE